MIIYFCGVIVIKNKAKPSKKKRIISRIIDVILIILIIVFCVWQNNDITVTRQNYVNSEIPAEFNGYKIVHISDLHNTSFGKNNKKLISIIADEQPDIIVITGDIIDKFRTNEEVAVEFVQKAREIAPVYYVSGNHESWLDNYYSLAKEFEDAGAVIAEDKVEPITIGNASIDIIGLKDIHFNNEKSLPKLMNESKSEFNIVLSHEPQLFDTYKQCNADLVFCGHAHGGQVRLPFIGGLYAPDQGAFPDYTAGLYTQDNTTMCVSRGLGNSVFPIRVFNRPEVVSLTLNNS